MPRTPPAARGSRRLHRWRGRSQVQYLRRQLRHSDDLPLWVEFRLDTRLANGTVSTLCRPDAIHIRGHLHIETAWVLSEQNKIRILFHLARFAQVAKPRFVILAMLNLAIQLRQQKDRHIVSACCLLDPA